MKGYRKEPQKTAEAIDSAGWLHTGEHRIHRRGYLRIIDRKKELIINASARTFHRKHRNTIKAACPLIGTVMVVGEARPYNTALIVLDADSSSTNIPYSKLVDEITAVSRLPTRNCPGSNRSNAFAYYPCSGSLAATNSPPR